MTASECDIQPSVESERRSAAVDLGYSACADVECCRSYLRVVSFFDRAAEPDQAADDPQERKQVWDPPRWVNGPPLRAAGDISE